MELCSPGPGSIEFPDRTDRSPSVSRSPSGGATSSVPIRPFLLPVSCTAAARADLLRTVTAWRPNDIIVFRIGNRSNLQCIALASDTARHGSLRSAPETVARSCGPSLNAGSPDSLVRTILRNGDCWKFAPIVPCRSAPQYGIAGGIWRNQPPHPLPVSFRLTLLSGAAAWYRDRPLQISPTRQTPPQQPSTPSPNPAGFWATSWSWGRSVASASVCLFLPSSPCPSRQREFR